MKLFALERFHLQNTETLQYTRYMNQKKLQDWHKQILVSSSFACINKAVTRKNM